MRSTEKRKLTDAFTQIELLLVVIITGILGTVALSQFLNFRQDAKIAMTNSKLEEFRKAMQGVSDIQVAGNYSRPGLIHDIGAIPDGLNALISQGSYSSYDMYKHKGWRGPYLDSTNSDWNVDAWGSPLAFDPITGVVRSCGEDKICGNADDIDVSVVDRNSPLHTTSASASSSTSSSLTPMGDYSLDVCMVSGCSLVMSGICTDGTFYSTGTQNGGGYGNDYFICTGSSYNKNYDITTAVSDFISCRIGPAPGGVIYTGSTASINTPRTGDPIPCH